jgi:hypothetical protein
MSVERTRFAILLAIFTFMVAMVFLGCHKAQVPPSNPEDGGDPYSSQLKDPLPTPSRPEVRFPRRLLFIQVGKYMTLPPLVTAEAGASERTRSESSSLAKELRVPMQKDEQLSLLSDSAGGVLNNIPSRAVIVDAFDRFFDTSTDQERIVVYFSGHALEVDGKAYLAPAEGDKNNPKTLIPLEEFYAKLKACKAAQKVVIWEVCRLNPERKREVRASEPMSPALFKSLTTPPQGVEVVVACQPGEHALEFSSLQVESSAARYNGSAFLESVKYVADKKMFSSMNQSPHDPIPVAEWIAVVGKRVAEMASASDAKLKQTVRSFPAPSQLGDFVPEPVKPQPVKTVSAAVQAIVDEFRVPQLKSSRPALVLSEHPYREELISAYKSDVSIEEIKKNKKKYELRNVTLNAFETLRDVWGNKPKGGLKQRDYVMAPISEGLKKEVNAELAAWGIGIAKLEEVDRALEAVASQKKSQPLRWQAHYDYARAVVKSRLAFMNEYDRLMGDVRTEVLPQLDKGMNQNAYRLAPAEKMKSKKDVQAIAEAAQEAFHTVIVEHKDTPWAVQAEYEKSYPLGLSWQPTHRDK